MKLRSESLTLTPVLSNDKGFWRTQTSNEFGLIALENSDHMPGEFGPVALESSA